MITENFASGEVEEDEIVGWDLEMQQSEANNRQYSLCLALLDPEVDEHPVPCYCGMAKCALMVALMEKEERDMEDLEEIT